MTMVDNSKFVVVGVMLLAFIFGFFVNLIMIRNGFLLDVANVSEQESYEIIPTMLETPSPETVTVTVETTKETTVTATATTTAMATVTATVTKEIKKPAPSCDRPAVDLQPSPSIMIPNTTSNTTEPVPYCHRNYKYLIMSTQRSGTHYLGETLSLNPDFNLRSEIFKAAYIEPFKQEFNINISSRGYTDFGRKDLSAIVLQLVYGFGPTYYRNNTSWNRIRRTDGIILHHNQAQSTPQLLPMLGESRSWKAIHLKRFNAFHVFVSIKMLEVTRAPHCPANGTCPTHTLTITLDPTEVFKYIERHERILQNNRQLLRQHRIPFIEVVYEVSYRFDLMCPPRAFLSLSEFWNPCLCS
eukprot:TRINITY_DN1318_c0_g1_i1.p1 TRINITY_DN1318_c0_g1~~TRINITY_DN1318_c0_g1_i1.p1  ORF type:complete len:356 (+),score=29.52 TRINITY_DN1318_c0_g1_i1:134-1201(+)